MSAALAGTNSGPLGLAPIPAGSTRADSRPSPESASSGPYMYDHGIAADLAERWPEPLQAAGTEPQSVQKRSPLSTDDESGLPPSTDPTAGARPGWRSAM